MILQDLFKSYPFGQVRSFGLPNWNLKIDGWNMKFPFKMVPFQGLVNFRAGTYLHVQQTKKSTLLTESPDCVLSSEKPWLVNLTPPNLHLRNKGLMAGLIKGNQWLSQALIIRPARGAYDREGGRLTNDKKRWNTSGRGHGQTCLAASYCKPHEKSYQGNPSCPPQSYPPKK